MKKLLKVLVLLLSGALGGFGCQASLSHRDSNQDGNVNVADVQSVVNEALGVTTATHDLNNDGSVSVADVQVVINAALGLGCAGGLLVQGQQSFGALNAAGVQYYEHWLTDSNFKNAAVTSPSSRPVVTIPASPAARFDVEYGYSTSNPGPDDSGTF